MKRYSFLIRLLMLMPVFCACNEWLEESNFTPSISSSTFYNTPGEAAAAVLAPLDIMRSTSIGGANYFTVLESMTEYCYTKTGTYQETNYYKDYTNGNLLTRNDGHWPGFFRSILFCNIPIQRIPNANAMTEDQKTSYLGELRFIRALNYLHVVRRWGGVPLRTEDNMAEWDLPKSSVNEIYDFIVNDLKYAVEYCPATPRMIGTPCKNAAKALLSEVYMYTKDYASAKTLAEEVINSNLYSLVKVSNTRDFDKVFGPDIATSSEEVFYIKTSRTDNKLWNYMLYVALPEYEIDGRRMSNGQGYNTHYLDLRNDIIGNWDQNDLRYNLNVGPYAFDAARWGEHTAIMIKFYDYACTGSGSNNNIPLIRYTDVLITYAEALARVAGSPTAQSIEILNQMRRRGYGFDPNVENPELDYKLSDYDTMDKFIDLLIQEEIYERMGEAKHWDFIVRLGKEKERVAKYFNANGAFNYYDPSVGVQETYYLWRIPLSEFNYNKALDQSVDQNPGYNL